MTMQLSTMARSRALRKSPAIACHPPSDGAVGRRALGLPNQDGLCQHEVMFSAALLRLLLALAVLGLVAGPAGAATGSPPLHALQALPAAGMESEGDMSCCPDRQPVQKPCGLSCALAPQCGAPVADGRGAVAWRIGCTAAGPAPRPMQERPPASALVAPPERPPRT